MKNNKITAIILAAGQGKRMNSPVAKQFLTLRDKPVLYYSLKAFEESSVDDIILVMGTGQVEYCKENIVEPYHFTKVSQVIEGGRERYDSVFLALESIGQTGYVLIHDGARPFITAELIEKVIMQMKEYRACIVGTPVKETIKVVDSEGFIVSSPDRTTLWSAQTPQAFEYESIRKAYDLFDKVKDKSGTAVTDDAMVYEMFIKQPVKMIPGDYHNIKITTPEDFILAEILMKDILYENNKKIEQLKGE